MSVEDLERRLERELDEAARQATVSPDAWQQIEERLDPTPARSRWWTRGGPVLAAAAVVVVVVVGVTAVLTRPGVIVRDRAGDPSAPAVQSSPGSAAPAATTVEQVAIDQRPDTRVEDVASRGPVVVAVGSVGPETAAAYRSSDGGRTWRTIQLPGPPGQASGVAATADGFVAGGVQIREGQPNQAVLWRSSDGTSWQRVLGDVAGNVHDVAADGRTVVAVGDGGSGGDRGGGAWRSTDGGRTFDAVPAADGSFAGGPATFLHEAALRGGRIVAAGQDQRGSRAALWTAPVGGPFELVADTPVTSGSNNRVLAVGASPEGFLAAREGGAVFRSTDGTDWAAAGQLPEPDLGPATSEPELQLPPVQPHTVRRGQGGWTVIGSIAGSPTASLVRWRSTPDGWRLRAVDDTGPGSSRAATDTPDGLVAVGVRAAAERPGATAWLLTPAD